MSSIQRPGDMPDDMLAFNRKLVEEFRANGGRLSGPLANSRLMLLTTRGARSGGERTVVIGYRPLGNAYAVIASNNAAPSPPRWYFNLMRDPEATVEIGTERFRARARVAEGEERERAAGVIEYLAPQQAKAQRQIPVIVLERI
jgi:deazaflavin-dependent oxidoreductase (nitroreductase family)